MFLLPIVLRAGGPGEVGFGDLGCPESSGNTSRTFLGSFEHPGALMVGQNRRAAASAGSGSDWGGWGEMLRLLTPGNRESARCRRCRPAPGVPAAVPRRAGVLCPVRVKKAPFVRQGRPVTNERLQPPAPGQTGMGRNIGMGQKFLSWWWGS